MNRSRQKRNRDRANCEELVIATEAPTHCINCLEPIRRGGGHFMPPSFGDEGYYICQYRPVDDITYLFPGPKIAL